GVRAEAVARLERDGDRGVDARQLLDRDAEREEVGPLSSVLLREREAEQPQLSHLLHDVDRKLRLAVHLLRAWRDDLPRELADRLSELLLLGREVEVHRPKPSPYRRARTRSGNS